jgi:response regulator RpfG family c-di-GMP phosphodiesterase
MRIKIMLLGDDRLSLAADAQLLRERGMLVYTSFNLANVAELATEIDPDVIFFGANGSDSRLTDLYNILVKSPRFAHIPVVFTFAEDDIYLVTRKRTELKDKRTIISDNIIDAVKTALSTNTKHHKLPAKTHNHHQGGAGKAPGILPSDAQMRIPFFS